MTNVQLRELWEKLIDLLEKGASIYDEEADHLVDDIENEFAKLAHREIDNEPNSTCGNIARAEYTDIMANSKIIADALEQEAANLSGFSGKCKKIDRLDKRIALLRRLAMDVRHLADNPRCDAICRYNPHCSPNIVRRYSDV